jgi:hypothetical protein
VALVVRIARAAISIDFRETGVVVVVLARKVEATITSGVEGFSGGEH